VLAQIKRAARVVRAVVREKAKSVRSSKWRAVRKTHMDAHPECAVCAATKLLQVHHVTPFSDRPDLELEPTNLITLCMTKTECHLLVGHGDRFSCFNPHVVQDAKVVRANPALLAMIVSKAERSRLDKP